MKSLLSGLSRREDRGLGILGQNAVTANKVQPNDNDQDPKQVSKVAAGFRLQRTDQTRDINRVGGNDYNGERQSKKWNEITKPGKTTGKAKNPNKDPFDQIQRIGTSAIPFSPAHAEHDNREGENAREINPEPGQQVVRATRNCTVGRRSTANN